jgi:pyruvate/2-oxoglutarate dehydrogenase complex dihydrolipoamide acyltransferase (E2) component
MPTQVVMPKLGESVVEGTVSKWLKQEGDAVAEYEPLIEVTTDKVDTEIPAPAAGTLLKIIVPAGATVNAGAVLAYVGQPGETLPVEAGTPPPAAARPQAAKELGLISPVVARLAAEHGIDLTQVPGTGAGGRITKKDVQQFIEAGRVPAWEQPGDGELFRPTEEVLGHSAADTRPAPAAPGDRAVALTGMRRAIAEHMLRSKQTAPQVTTVMEADLSRVIAHRAEHKPQFAAAGVQLTYTAYFVLAAAAALKAHPQVNSAWAEDKILIKQALNIGVAAALDDGLIVPVIRDAGQKPLRQIAAEVNDLAARARRKELRPDEVTGGTFTITNHGVFGSLLATPIIHQPQCAILGVGAIEKRVKVIADAIAIRPLAYLSLTFDHRIIDGAQADRFLAEVKRALEEWE